MAAYLHFVLWVIAFTLAKLNEDELCGDTHRVVTACHKVSETTAWLS